MPFAALSNREVRRVPLGWEHPRNEQGHFIPLHEYGTSQYTEAEIEEGIAEGWILPREALAGSYMPDFSAVPAEQMGLCAYETTSEGTPISPVFPDSSEGRPALLQYCAEHCTIFGRTQGPMEAWAAVLFGDGVTVNLTTGQIEALANP